MRKRIIYFLSGVIGLGIGTYAFLRALSTPVPDHAFLENQGRILVMAHRGGKGLWPPNTLYAFERAAEMGVDVLEMDIHRTADGVLVVRHDPTVDATTDGSGYIRDLTLAEVKALDAGYRWTADEGQTYPYRGKGITIPTLEEVLLALPDIRLNIDIKPEDPTVVEPFCQMLTDYNKLDQVMVGSFHDEQLRRFREYCPQVATAAGVSETRLFYLLNRAFLGAVFHPRAAAFQVPEYNEGIHLVTPSFVEGAQAHNMQVHVWTVNETADMERLISWGADGIITDYPDRLMALLKR